MANTGRAATSGRGAGLVAAGAIAAFSVYVLVGGLEGTGPSLRGARRAADRVVRCAIRFRPRRRGG